MTIFASVIVKRMRDPDRSEGSMVLALYVEKVFLEPPWPGLLPRLAADNSTGLQQVVYSYSHYHGLLLHGEKGLSGEVSATQKLGILLNRDHLAAALAAVISNIIAALPGDFIKLDNFEEIYHVRN